MNIIITSLQPWDSSTRNNVRHIAEQMSLSNRVLYIDPPKDIASVLIHHHKLHSGIRKINDNTFVANLPFMIIPINRISSPLLFDNLNHINNRKYAIAIAKAAAMVGFDEFSLIIDNDIYGSLYLKEYLKPKVQIYYRRDWLISSDRFLRHGERLEPTLAAKSDAVVTSTKHLAQTISNHNANTHCVDQGFDFESFSLCKTKPINLNMKHPVVGCVGNISRLRLDADFMYEIFSMRPQYSFMVVGFEDEFFRNHKLHKLPNVFFENNVLPNEYPSYIAAFDVCINPQSMNNIALSSFPRRIMEYISMGKLVVARESLSVTNIGDGVIISRDSKDFCEKLDYALENSCEELPDMKFKIRYSWENSTEKIIALINSLSKS